MLKALTVAGGLVSSIFMGHAALADALVVYDFSEGVAGEHVGKVANHGSLAGEFGGTAAESDGGSVTYSDDLPGKFLYADQDLSERISDGWKSVEFKATPNPAGGNNGKGAIIDVPGLGERLAQIGAGGDFTVECFVKVATDAVEWVDFFKFFYKSDILDPPWGSTDDTQVKYVIWHPSNMFGVQMSWDNPLNGPTVERERWYHIAMVYTQPNEEQARGAWKMYANGRLYATQYATIMGIGKTEWFRMGGASTTTETFSGKLTGLRITDSALPPEKFLKASAFDPEKQAELDGALGVWPCIEGEVGAEVVGSGNLIDPDDKLLGAALGTDGKVPTYSDDVPGSCLYSAANKVIAKGLRSVKFYGSSDNKAGSKLTVVDIGSRMARHGAFTLEFFCKFDESFSWRNMFAMRSSPTNTFKVCNRTDANSITTQYYLDGGGNPPEHFLAVSPSMLGNWHHVALAWDLESQKLTFYIDYTKFWEQESVVFARDSNDGFFGCTRFGTCGELFNGKICGVRLMPRRLKPAEMMYAAEEGSAENYDERTIFHWSFEEPTAVDGGDVTTVNGAPRNLGPYRGATQQQNSHVPTYTSEVYKPRKEFTAQGKSFLSPNKFSAYFYGYSERYNNSWAGSHLAQQSVVEGFETRPESFTLEMFIRRDLNGRSDGVNGQMVGGFGGAGINTQTANTDWYLFLSPYDGNRSLTLSYFDQVPGSAIKQANTGISLEDGQWHHLAMCYDNETKAVTFYADYELKKTIALPNGLRRTIDKSWKYAFGRGFNTSGFNGWMDDIRLSEGVRPVEEFLNKSSPRHGNYIILQ